MSVIKNIAPDQSSSANNEFLYGILEAYNKWLTEKKNQIDFSKTMLGQGAKTDLTMGLESIVNNPLQELCKLSDNVGDLAKSFLDILVKNFLEKKSAIIDTAFRTASKSNDLHYSIILKRDTLENRKSIFSFLNDYEISELSSKFPIYFQFVPKKMKKEMEKKYKVS